MEVITIESQIFKDLTAKINAISNFVIAIQKEKEHEQAADGWVDSFEVCAFLKISSKTLQRLRTAQAVAYSQIRGKYFYRISEIHRLLNDNVIRRSDEHLQNMIKNHQLQAEKRRTNVTKK